MAGHKYVSSTEGYRMDTLVELQKELEKYHPLKGNKMKEMSVEFSNFVP